MTGDPTTSAGLRSAAWLGGDDEVAVLHRVALHTGTGDPERPVIGIADTTSGFNPCHAGFTATIPVLERAITDAGGEPVRFPVMSLGEDLMKPSAMLYRNLVAMELEEQVRAYPMDGVVFLANCDKTVPAALLAAVSTGVPSLLLLGGARAATTFRGRPMGSGTGLWQALDERRAGRLDDTGWAELENTLACADPGACNTMGTASTMALVTETLGMCLPGSCGQEAGGDALLAISEQTARAVVDQVHSGTTAVSRVDQRQVDNALAVLAAAGGSTNAVIHLAAVAGRLGLEAGLAHADAIWREVPLLVDVEPCGRGSIQEFAADGGLPRLAAALGMAGLADLTAPTADGTALAAVSAGLPAREERAHAVVRGADDPLAPAPALAAVFGSLAPDGAVIKVAAASPQLLQHEGPVVVFDDYAQLRARLDSDELTDPALVIVVRNCGPVGVPGMPEWGMAPLPRPLLEAGVRDLLRVSDGRMSGTSFGTVVVHVAPESAVGGPLALVEDGDTVRLDLAARRLDLLVEPAELERRRAAWTPPVSSHLRGWPALYQRTVLQAPEGCDLDFLAAPTPESRRFVPPVVGRS